MRIDRLDITGFGTLRNLSLELHPRITVLVGPNESGKSTVHRAIRAALYGIDAGGQGRPVDRSEWARWTPWGGGPYGIALTYTLDDGRRIRVARRLEQREHAVQVLELGGSDLTDELRIGRVVCPGQTHLGIDEQVFCATSWLGDESLRLTSPDASGAHAARLQEAMERLVDTRRGTTARRALVLLDEAAHRVGSERRSTSPLGAASARLRDLERAIDDGRRRRAALGAEEERLRALEAQLALLAREADERERAWLSARLAWVEDRRSRLAATHGAIAEHRRTLEDLGDDARFPEDIEPRAHALASALAEAQMSAAEAAARWDAAASVLSQARRRRTEIAAGRNAIAATPVTDDAANLRCEVGARLEAARVVALRLEQEAVADARLEGLRREVAATGLGALDAGTGGAIRELVALRRSRTAVSGGALGAFVVAAGAIVAAIAMHTRGPAVMAALAALAVIAAAGGAIAEVHQLRRRREAAQRIRILEEDAGVAAADAETLSERLPALQALQAALGREEERAQARAAMLERLDAEARTVCGSAQSLLTTMGIAPPPGGAGASTAALLDLAAECLARFDQAAEAQRRRAELDAEDAALARREEECLALEADAARLRDHAAGLRSRLEELVRGAGMKATGSPAEMLAAVRAAAERRRAYDEAARAEATARTQAALLGDVRSLDIAAAQLRDELHARGQDEAVLPSPVDDAVLQQLEVDARRARQAAHIAEAQAAELRSRLAGIVEAGPDLAELENERDVCATARARAQHQLRALSLAATLIQDAAQTKHRDVAPRLAALVTERLSLLTDDRYSAVNIDTDRFAVSLLCAERPDMVPLEMASHGTRDQVSLLLRIALCDVLGTGREPIPLLFDEPLLTSDPVRRDCMIEFLHDLSATNQVVVSTSDPAVAGAARRVCGDACSIVAMDDVSAANHVTRRAVHVVS